MPQENFMRICSIEVFWTTEETSHLPAAWHCKEDFDWFVNLPKEKVLKNPTTRKSSWRNRTLTLS